MTPTLDEPSDLIPPTAEVRRLLALRASEAARLRRLLRLAVLRDRDAARVREAESASREGVAS
jgi:hypothetical protein